MTSKPDSLANNKTAYQSKSTLLDGEFSIQEFRLIWVGALLLLLLLAFPITVLSPLRVGLGLLYVLYVPGYCLMVALFPRQDDLDSIERMGMSIGLSIGVVPLLALLLDNLPWGIRLWPILLGEYGVMALSMGVALWRRQHLSAELVYAPELSWRPRPWWGSLPPLEKRIYTLLVSALLIAALSAAWVFLVPSPDEFMTEFYILGQEGLAEAYPREATVGEELSVTIGMMNHERGEHDYRIDVWVTDSWSKKRELVLQKDALTLPRNHAREEVITWSMPWQGQDQIVEFLLFIDDNQQPYRQLRLWLDVMPATD